MSWIYNFMRNLRTYSEFLLESISKEIYKHDEIFREIDGPERRQLEGAGRLMDISIQHMQDPVNPGKSGEYITLTFSDISTPIPYPFIEFSQDHSYCTYPKTTLKHIEDYFKWVDSLIKNGYFTATKIYDLQGNFFGMSDEYYKRVGLSKIIDSYHHKYRKEVQFLDISDRSYQNLTEYSDLIKLGATEVTTGRQLKNGTIALKFGNRTVMIHSNGYVRTSFGDRVSILFKTPEANKPIETSDDLSLKMRMIYLFLLKNDVLKPEGIDSKTIKLVMDSYVTPNSTNYKDVYDMLVNKNPKLSLYLTPPSEGYNKKMIKGAGLLKSLGIF
jgi:hypothetical protein